MRGHEKYKEMLAAHALDALDAEEARELEAHLAGCAECRAELDAWRETSASLACAVPAVEPSAKLRPRILASVRTADAQDASRSALGDDGKAERRDLSSSQVESKVVPLAKPARRAWSMASMVGALAASLVFVALIVSLLMLWNRYTTTQQEAARLSDRLNQTQGELEREREAEKREREITEMMTAPETRVTTLAGTEMASAAHAKFVLDRKTGRAMLMAYNLPPAPAGKAYQLWYIMEGKPPMPGHVFTTDAQGRVEMHDQVPVEALGATIFAVTLEPSTGMDAPTGPKYLLGSAS